MSRFTIALSGLAEADSEAIKTALNAMPGDTWALTDAMPATLLVVDIDSVWGHMDWLRATASGQRVVAFSKDEHVRDCDLVLHNPLHEDEMTALLQSVEAVTDDQRPPPRRQHNRKQWCPSLHLRRPNRLRSSRHLRRRPSRNQPRLKPGLSHSLRPHPSPSPP